MYRLRLVLLLVCVTLIPLAASQIKVDVQLVNVVATVTDGRGRYVPDLTAEDFIVKEDGKIQTISHLTQSTDLPVSVGILLDSSGSMERRMGTATTAVERFIRSIHEDDDIFLMTFSSRPMLLQGFTNDRSRLSNALRRVSVGGETALYDAMDEGLKELRRGLYPKKAILLITDGQDTASRLSMGEVLLDVRESESLVYSLGISGDDNGAGPISGPSRVPTTPPIISTDPSGRRTPGINSPFPTIPTINIPGGTQRPGGRGIPPKFPLVASTQRQRLPGGVTVTASDSVDMNVLDSFAEDSGGRSWLLSPSWMDNRGSEINRALDEIATELRSQYSIDYYPTHPIKDGKRHQIEVSVKDKSYRVRARKEYVGR